jgi:hypothetical protein
MRASGVQPRRARTLSGAVEYERAVYECPRCRASAAPLDGELGLAQGDQLSRAVMRKVAWSAATSSFAWAALNMREMAGVEVSAAECQRAGLEVGRRVEARQREEEARRLAPASPERPAPAPEIACERLVMEADATCVLTVAGQEHKSVYCARAFGLEDRANKKESGRAFVNRSRVAASAVDMEDFALRLKALGHRMGLRAAREVAFVADGAPCLWNWAKENLPKGRVLIQDYWHVAEHLAQLCRDVYEEAPDKSERLQRWKQALLESRASEVIEDLRGEHKRRRGAKRERLEKEIHYLEAGRGRMDYARYREEGWPIGSGAVEATCKHLIKERFGLTGARWDRKNIAPIAALRVAILNDEWDSAWNPN